VSLNNPPPGAGSVQEYQVAGIPWVTSSLCGTAVIGIDFPFVTQFIAIKNPTGNARVAVAFTAAGFSSHNAVPLDAGESITLPLRVKSLWLSGTNGQNITVIAGLTCIQSRFFPTLTGSNGQVGIG